MRPEFISPTVVRIFSFQRESKKMIPLGSPSGMPGGLFSALYFPSIPCRGLNFWYVWRAAKPDEEIVVAF